MLLWQRHYFPINPFKMVLGFSPRCCLLILCKDTHRGGGVRAGEVGSSEELKEGCVLGMLQSLRVEGEQSASTTEEKECSSGSGIPLASTRLFFLFLSLVPSFFFFFPCWDLRSSLGSWDSQKVPLAGPKWGRLVQGILSALTWISHSRGCQIPAFQGVKIVF